MTMDEVRVRVLPDGRMARADAALFLGVAVATMASWANKGIGPMPRRVGGRVFYYLRDVEAYRDTGARKA